MTRERIRFETESLRLYNQHAPGLAPTIYDYDDEMSLVAMEYLSDHLIMQGVGGAATAAPLCRPHLHLPLPTRFSTRRISTSPVWKKDVAGPLYQPLHLCKIQEILSLPIR
ncbi:MAG: hypothetical protein R2932_45995 [Caldilineaceae bacterium]